MRISRIEIENFKGIGARQKIDLRPVTLLFAFNHEQVGRPAPFRQPPPDRMIRWRAESNMCLNSDTSTPTGQSLEDTSTSVASRRWCTTMISAGRLRSRLYLNFLANRESMVCR